MKSIDSTAVVRRPPIGSWFALLALVCHCGSSGSSEGDEPDAARDIPDAGPTDSGIGDPPVRDAADPDAAHPDQAARCAVECEGDAGAPSEDATCFGGELTDGFGRIDGSILAVQRPDDTQGPWPNDDHLIAQVLMHGAAYRMVVNIESDGRNGTDTEIRFAQVRAPLPAPSWEEGWHLDAPLDYVATLGVHDEDFTPYSMDELVERVAAELDVGAPVSVYASSRDRPESAHLIHRNASGADGAIVVDPTAPEPRFLLYHFDGQEF